MLGVERIVSNELNANPKKTVAALPMLERDPR
jgi:hypothetical protein